MSADLDPKRLDKANRRARPHLKAAISRIVDDGVDLHLAAYAMVSYGCVALGYGVTSGLFSGSDGAARLREFAQAVNLSIEAFAARLETGEAFDDRKGD